MDILKGGDELEVLKLAWDSRQLMDLEWYCPAPSARAPPKVHEHEQEQAAATTTEAIFQR